MGVRVVCDVRYGCAAQVETITVRSFGRGAIKLVWGQGAFTPGIHQ